MGQSSQHQSGPCGINERFVRRAAPLEVAFGCATLVWVVQKSRAGPGGSIPELLLIAPPVLGEVSGLMGLFFKGGEETSRGLARAYETVADACRCRFLDASKHVRASQIDGVHLDLDGHRALALAVKNVVAASLIGV